MEVQRQIVEIAGILSSQRGALVKGLIDHDTRWWKKNLIEEVFNPKEARVIQAIPISAMNLPDKQVWRGNARGTFSVSSAYYMAKDRVAAHHAKCSVRENLVRRKVTQDPSCPICGMEKELVYHVLWECIATKDVWGASAKFFQKSSFDAHDFLQVSEHFFQTCAGKDLQLFVVTTQKIWFRRNTWIHEGKFAHLNMLVLGSKRAVEELQFLYQGCEETSAVTKEIWQTPAKGWVKLNCDATCDKHKGYMGMGVIIRDHSSQVMAARSTTRLGYFEPTVAEAMSLLHGVSLCKELGFQNLMVEGDAQIVI
ncbi:uncharacterized protein LOC132178115 [Corylus avellana]|uniref:uncharacterized protein LOC132178115 n=1 Tax=Corylus avellana TaxID=13451 RepID=UPI00286BC2FC|nr:uncharacterized protein LOC132178115 [Corylus avellana]